MDKRIKELQEKAYLTEGERMELQKLLDIKWCNPSQDDEHLKRLQDEECLRKFKDKFMNGMKDCPPEFNSVFVDRFEDLLA